MRVEGIQKHYEKISRTPFYLFAFPVLFAGLVLILIKSNHETEKEKAMFVANPKVGDVYGIRVKENNKSEFYFLRLVRINGDTVVAYHSNLEYSGSTSKMNINDFFVKDEELYFLKSELKEMLDKMEISSVDRSYGEYEGFNRIR